jgi:hypothetical protein
MHLPVCCPCWRRKSIRPRRPYGSAFGGRTRSTFEFPSIPYEGSEPGQIVPSASSRIMRSNRGEPSIRTCVWRWALAGVAWVHMISTCHAWFARITTFFEPDLFGEDSRLVAEAGVQLLMCGEGDDKITAPCGKGERISQHPQIVPLPQRLGRRFIWLKSGRDSRDQPFRD